MWRVLVVDDIFENRELIKAILDGRAECDIACNGQEALDACIFAAKNNKPYDIILLDIAMPEVNGIEFLKKIREGEALAGGLLGEGVPIIMITAHKTQFVEAFNGGCDDYMLKPIVGEDLIKKIEEKLDAS